MLSRLGSLIPVSALTLSLAVAACGSDPFAGRDSEFTTGSAPLGGVCPGANTVEGVDVSTYQRDVDWQAVANSGRQFAIIRLSDGLGVDARFDQNWAGAKSAGLIRGVYQFYRSTHSGAAQANLLLQHVSSFGPGDLPPVLDVEVTNGASASVMAAGVQEWVNTISSATGTTPIIYTGSYFWNDNVKTNALSNNPLWIAQYGPHCPAPPHAWTNWTFHQYSEKGSVPGISGNVDLDVFNGSLSDLQALAGGAATPPPPTCTAHCEGDVVVDDNCNQTDCTQTSALCSTAGNVAPHCVATACVSSADDVPTEHDVCTSTTTVSHCTADGQLTNPVTCPDGKTCTDSGSGSVSCVDSNPNGGDMDGGTGGDTDGGTGGDTDGGTVGDTDGGTDGCTPGCNGTVLTAADCSTVDCNDSGAYCSTATDAPSCVATDCVSGPDEAPYDHDVCLADGNLAHCDSNGQLGSETACQDGSSCILDDTGNASCGDGTTVGPSCTPSCNGTVLTNADCTQTDCNDSSAYCSTGTATPQCVSTLCVLSADELPEPHDTCLADGTLGHCDENGQIAGSTSCGDGSSCAEDELGNGMCTAPTCTPSCDGTTLTNADCSQTDCAASNGYCSTAAGATASCASALCVASPDETPVEHTICLDDGTIAQCGADGQVGNGVACNDGTACALDSNGDGYCDDGTIP